MTDSDDLAFSLVPLTLVHAPLMAGLHQICFRDPWSERAMTELLAMPGCFGWLLDRNAPCGFILARLAADEAEILTLLVLPPYRRQGLAEMLLTRAELEAQAGGGGRMFLEVAANNDAGIRLYGKAGFAQVGVRPRYYADGIDALLMAKTLGKLG